MQSDKVLLEGNLSVNLDSTILSGLRLVTTKLGTDEN